MRRLLYLLAFLSVTASAQVWNTAAWKAATEGIPASAVSGAGPYTLSKSNWVVTTSATLFTTTNLQLTSVPSTCTYVAFVKHEGSPTTISITDGTTTFTGGTKIDSGANTSPVNDLHSQLFYSLTPSTSGTVTFTVTFGAGVKFISIFVVAYTHGAGTPVFDGEPTGGGASGNSTGNISSGSYTLTANNDLTFCGYASYGNSLSTEQIGGVTRVNQFGRDANNCECYDRPLTATGSGVSMAATAQMGSANAWNLNFITIK